jgi:hypothetical protein
MSYFVIAFAFTAVYDLLVGVPFAERRASCATSARLWGQWS